MKKNKPRCARCGFFFEPPGFLDFSPSLCSDCYAAKRNNNTKINNDYSVRVSKSAIESEFKEHLKALVMLCHPDRHGNNELSNRVSKWLIPYYKGEKY